MDEMKRSQAKRIARDIYGNVKDEMIKTEKDAWDGIIDDMLAVLPRVEEEYLVSGARLKCNLASFVPQYIDGMIFSTYKPGTSFLEVENKDSIDNKPKANINDYKENKNIFPFGNCTAALTPDEIQRLKGSAKARVEGTCSELIKICGPWENEPAKGGMEYFKYNGYPGINGMSKLFCFKMGQIMAETSGQENRNISKAPGALTKEDLRFAFQHGISGKKLYALADIRDYFAQYPDLSKKTTIFAFEGLADEKPHGSKSTWNGDNTYHSKGQFGAIMIVAKEGKLTHYEENASTLPDDMESSATVCEGVYWAKCIKHKQSKTYVNPYAALRLYKLDGSGTVDAYNSKNKNDTATGINLHMAGKMTSASAYSEGCITVPVRRYRNFGVEVGFIKAEGTEGAGKDGSYGKAKKALLYETYAIKEYEGYIVIDRENYTDSGGYLKYNGPKKAEENETVNEQEKTE